MTNYDKNTKLMTKLPQIMTNYDTLQQLKTKL